MKVECNNCEWRGESEDLDEIKDFYLRVEPGEETPSGQCPQCGALCSICSDEDEDDDDEDCESLTDEQRARYIKKARTRYASENIEIDDDARVSASDDGAFVQAWVWVSK